MARRRGGSFGGGGSGGGGFGARRGFGSSASSGASKAPPPQRTQSAPPPARQGVFGGSGGFMSTVMQGMAFGGGSAVAHRAVDAVLGSRSYHPAPVEATQAAQTVVQENMDCVESARPFVECMGISNGDMEACRTFFDRLQACRLALPQTNE